MNVAAVALGAVAHKNFIGSDLDAAPRIIVLDDGVDEKIIALLRAVAVKGFLVPHFHDGFLHGVDCNLWQGQCDVADAQADNVGGGVGFLERRHAAGYLREQVIAR